MKKGATAKDFMLSNDSLINDMCKIGLTHNMKLEVHSSLSSIGLVDGGAQTVISSLKDIISDSGSIVMPCFPLSKKLPLDQQDIDLGIIIKCRWLPANHTEKTDMGIISDEFANSTDVVIGTGQHRMAAWGCDARKYVSDFDSFINNNSFALLIGVDIRKFTAMHYVENNIPNELWEKLFSPMNDKIKDIYDLTEWFISTEENPKYFDGWLKIQKLANDKGIITNGKIGISKCIFLNVKSVLELYKDELIKDANKLFNV